MRALEVSNFDKLVSAVTKSILEKTTVKNSVRTTDKSVIVMIPNPVLGLSDYIDYMNVAYKGFGIQFCSQELVLDTMEIDKQNRIAFDINNKDFIQTLDKAERVVAFGLKVDQLRALADVGDNNDINHILITRAMRNLPVTILMNSNNNIFSKINEVINDIRKLGIEVINIQQGANPFLLENDLILEKDVLKLKDSGIKTIQLSPKQILSPLAKDKLREYRITIEYSKEDQR